MYTTNTIRVAEPQTFDPGRWRDQGLRRRLVASGALLPIEGRPTLRLDDRGRREARRACEAGDWGRKALDVPPSYWELGEWHQRALERRAAKDAIKRRPFLANCDAIYRRISAELAAR